METTTPKAGIDLSQLSKEEKAALLGELQKEQNAAHVERREAYEGLRTEFLREVRKRAEALAAHSAEFKKWLDEEARAFTAVMREYGQLRRDTQQSYTVTDGEFKLEIASHKVKAFDERADMAAERLMDYLKGYMQQSEKGTDDPMYQLAMTLLERNKQGDLDYKSISKLYELEDKFDGEYADIMQLFKEANVVQANATNYYFSWRDQENGVWHRVEPSFCRL